MNIPDFQNKNKQLQPVFDAQGLLTVDFQILPGRERLPHHWSRQTQIKGSAPNRNLRFTRLPEAGELLKLDHFVWCIRQIIHLPIDEYVDADDLFGDVPAPVAIVQVSFHGLS